MLCDETNSIHLFDLRAGIFCHHFVKNIGQQGINRIEHPMIPPIGVTRLKISPILVQLKLPRLRYLLNEVKAISDQNALQGFDLLRMKGS